MPTCLAPCFGFPRRIGQVGEWSRALKTKRNPVGPGGAATGLDSPKSLLPSQRVKVPKWPKEMPYALWNEYMTGDPENRDLTPQEFMEYDKEGRHLAPRDWLLAKNSSVAAMGKQGDVLPVNEPPPRFADIAAIIEAGCKLPMPEVVSYGAGRALFYSARINEVHGEPGQGKTWVALYAAKSVMEEGKFVLYVDPEDTEPGIISRLLSMGVAPDVLVKSFKLVSQPEPLELPGIAAWAKAEHPALVVFDGLAEMLTSHGLSEIDPGEVLRFFRDVIRPYTLCGSAVLITDHVIKDRESRGKWMRGTGAKMGRYDGAVYSLDQEKPFSRDCAGMVRLTVAKDRNGGVGAVGTQVGDLHITPMGEGAVKITLTPASDEKWKPTIVMERVCTFLGTNDGANKSQIRRGVSGRGEHIDQAIAELIKLGNVNTEKEGQSVLHYLSCSYNRPEEGQS